MTQAFKNMDRWLGDGGMPLIDALGARIEAYGVDGEDLGWASGSFDPSDLACNPRGIVQAGVHTVLLDAIINFAINSALRGRDVSRATLEIKTETMRPAVTGETYALRGESIRIAKQVAYGEGTVRDSKGELVSRCTATFLLKRSDG
jgi:uncharacterized protein (TIGR00369 family)